VPSAASGRLLWALAAAVLLSIGFVLLRGCDLAIFPLYGQKFCEATRSEALADERARADRLQAELRQAELTYAQKPKCAQAEPRRETPPPPSPQPPTPPAPPVHEPEQEKLKVPKRLSELRGCWESARGDLPIVSDDAEERPIGNVRKCFCFGENGRGVLKMLYTNGVKCRAPLVAKLQGDKLVMAHPEFSCPARGKNWGLVPSDTTCEESADAATCVTHSHGRHHPTTSTDQFRRVDQDHCSKI